MLKETPTTRQRNLIDQCSAFRKTFTRQYTKAASQRNHSRHAISITTPTMLVKTIYIMP